MLPILYTSHVCSNVLNFDIDFVVLVVNNFPIAQAGISTDFTGSYCLLLHVESY